ncbi:MAG: outer rane hemin/siderophore receptor protein [Paucimonas sp.]|nr:outer rane hemin/siderophore receptor protein [Paucimonas sp.]
MNSLVLRRCAAAAAIASTFPLVSPAHAVTTVATEEVLVTASRFDSDPAFAPIGATVITAEQIRASGAGNVNEAIRTIGGVYGRQNLAGSSDFSLDLRGFGSFSDQNLVVLVDGVRLSENEQAVAQLSSIPVDSVARVEIVRGGSSVLYGEGATGGTINIITRRPGSNQFRGSVFAEVGSFAHRDVRASVTQGWDQLSFDAAVGAQRADNYRANSETRQKNFNGGVQWATTDARLGLRINAGRQDMGLPGALTLAQFETDPHQADTPSDSGSVDTDRYTVFGEQRWGGLEAAFELSRAFKTAKATYVGFGSSLQMDSRVTQFSPRLRHLSSFGEVRNELVGGIDLQRWSRNTDSTYSQASAFQKSRGFYLRDEVRVGAARIAAGGRHEKFSKNFREPMAFPGFSTDAYMQTHSLNAWELQGSYTILPSATLFAKAGRSYRVGNVDDNAFTLSPNIPLEPQTSRDAEIGATFGSERNQATLKFFRHRLKNEIYYDPTFFANVNLDPTRRQGVEFDGKLQLAQSFALNAHAQHVSASFTDGANRGREVTLVPSNTATLRLNWLPQDGRSADIGMRWVDKQRYGGDFDNSCSARIPAFTVLDARYAQRFGDWEFALTGSNLTDKQHFTNAYGACRSGIYPDAGRQVKLSVRFNF